MALFAKAFDRFKAIIGRTKDLTPLIQPMRQIVIQYNKDRAMSGVDFQGHNYEHLAPATKKQRKALGYSPTGRP